MSSIQTGATGYIGGDVLFVIVKSQPDWDITCLVRNTEKGATVASQYPQIRLVYGDLDSVELLEEEAKNADIVYHMASSDHEASVQALAKGLASRSSDQPAFWIHVSGTGMFAYTDFANNSFGQESQELFDDWTNIEKILAVPDSAWHRVVEGIVRKAGTNHSDLVKTAIVSPPTIYGPGRGPDKTRSIQAYDLAREILKLKQGLVIGRGENVWTQVHVRDLSALFLALGQEAARGGGRATWGAEAYYFAESGEFVWGRVAEAIARDAYAKNLIPSPGLKSVPVTLGKEGEGNGVKHSAPSEEFDTVTELEENQIDPFLRYTVGSNARCKAIRARKVLGWTPKERSLFEEIPDIVDSEAKRLGLS